MAPLAASAAAPSDRQSKLIGHWCLRSLAAAGNVTLDGDAYDFRPDGTYSVHGELEFGGAWTLAANQLTLTNIGEHEVVELAADHFLLRRMGVVHSFYRECGPKLEQAQKVHALRQAAGKGDSTRVKLLVDQGVDPSAIDQLDRRERSALLSAVEEKRVEVATQLLGMGAKVTALDVAGNSVFDFARSWLPDLLPALEARLPVPASPDLPILHKLSETGACPEDYLPKSASCVHAAALARPALRDEQHAFEQGGESPTFATGSEAAAQVRTEETERDLVDSLALLDPSALSNPNARRAPSRVSARAGTRSASTSESKAKSTQRAGADPFKQFTVKTADGKTDIDREKFRVFWCKASASVIDDTRNGGNSEKAQALGMSHDQYLSTLESKHSRECP